MPKQNVETPEPALKADSVQEPQESVGTESVGPSSHHRSQPTRWVLSRRNL